MSETISISPVSTSLNERKQCVTLTPWPVPTYVVPDAASASVSDSRPQTATYSEAVSYATALLDAEVPCSIQSVQSSEQLSIGADRVASRRTEESPAVARARAGREQILQRALEIREQAGSPLEILSRVLPASAVEDQQKWEEYLDAAVGTR